MYSAVAVSHTWPRPMRARWLAVVAVSLLLHLSLLVAVSLPPPPMLPPVAPRELTLDFSLAAFSEPAGLEEAIPQAKPRPELSESAQAPAKPSPPSVQPEPSRSELVAPAASEKPAEGKMASPKAGEPPVEIRVADDTAKGQEQPPENPR